jgi:hypothetical protein
MIGAPNNWTGTPLESKRTMTCKLAAADKPVLRKTVRDSRQVLQVQQGRDNLEILVYLEVPRVQLVQEGRLARDRQGNLEYLVCLEVRQGLEDRSGRLVLGRQGIQEHRVYLEVQRVLGRQSSREFQLGQDSHPFLVYPEVLVGLNCKYEKF